MIPATAAAAKDRYLAEDSESSEDTQTLLRPTRQSKEEGPSLFDIANAHVSPAFPARQQQPGTVRQGWEAPQQQGTGPRESADRRQTGFSSGGPVRGRYDVVLDAGAGQEYGRDRRPQSRAAPVTTTEQRAGSEQRRERDPTPTSRRCV